MHSISLLVCLLVGAADNPATAADELLKKSFPADQPGAAVLVVRRGKIELLKGYGLADLEKKQPITPDTAFDLASVSKQFTAMAVMQLAERGKLNYDDPVRKWVPDLPAFQSPSELTLRDLLNQLSGLPDYLNFFHGSDEQFAKLTNADVPKMLKDKKLRFDPGTKFEYSNTNYAILPLVVERASGKPLARYLAENVFQPAGMKDTRMMDHVPFDVPNRANGYAKPLFGNKWEVSRRDGPICGDGNLFSTARDFAKWDEALANHTLVRRESLELAFTPGKLADGKSTDYGFGWVIRKKDGKKTVWHNGGWTGTHTMILRRLDDGLTVVVLCNDEGANPEKKAQEIVNLFD